MLGLKLNHVSKRGLRAYNDESFREAGISFFPSAWKQYVQLKKSTNYRENVPMH